MEQLPFVKMQAQGNDFVILDGLTHTLAPITPSLVHQICHRQFGVGCDQLLVLVAVAQANARMLIYNADGSQAANCGNGLRCVGQYLMQQLACEQVRIALADRIVTARRVHDAIEVDMGSAVVVQSAEDVFEVNIGNAHRVFFNTPEMDSSVNVEIVSAYDAHQATIRIIERGTGETLACGSGACATAAAIWQSSGLVAPLTIHMPGGDVVVSGSLSQLRLRGLVQHVFSGVYG